jgi:carboxylesterase type B
MPRNSTTTASALVGSAGLTKRTTLLVLAAVVCLLPASASTNHHHHQHQTGPATSVRTSSGLLKGLETQPHNSGYQSVTKFLNVPYAQAPVGQLRFRRPVELAADQANQTLDATRFGKTCPQHRHLTRFISPLLNLDQEHQISEDCLRLNVFVPSGNQPADQTSKQQRRLPVIVWIPGEGFDFADARQYDGSQLALRTQSIVVTVQYRVGALGLLDAPELGIDGNQAIHDQLMALRWVSKNIGAFGGDRDRVTVMGRFSGAMSISVMLTAPQQELVLRAPERRALFSRAVMTSGIAVDDWIIVDNQRNKLEQLIGAAQAAGLCKNDSSPTNEQRLECLQSMPVERLLELSGFQWRLVRDDQLISRQGGPIEALRQQRPLPRGIEAVLLGETGGEGTLCLYRHLLMADLNERAKLINENRLNGDHLNELIRDDLATYFQYNGSDSSQALEMALDALVDATTATTSSLTANNHLESQDNAGDGDRYDDDAQTTTTTTTNHDELRQRYLDACSSYMVKSHNQRFKRHLQQVASATSNGSHQVQLQHYQLNYKPSFSLAPHYIRTAAHGDDVPLIFGLVYNKPNEINQADVAMSQKMLAYIGDFVHGRQRRDSSNNKIQRAPATAAATNQHKRQLVYLFDASADELNGAGEQEVALVGARPDFASNQLATTTKLIIVETEDDGAAPRRAQQQPQTQPQQPQQQQQLQSVKQIQLQQVVADDAVPLTRSQKLLELHKQQVLDEGLWLQRRAQLFGSSTALTTATATTSNNGPDQQQPQQQQPQRSASLADGQLSAAAAETSLATMLLLTASIVILALMSVCVVLSVLVVRYNALSACQEVGAAAMGGPHGKRTQQFRGSSTCDICDESQGGSIDAVLGQHTTTGASKKNEHAFCNVFAKLRNQNQTTTTTTTTTQHNTNGTAAARPPVAAVNGAGDPQAAGGCGGGQPHGMDSHTASLPPPPPPSQ